MNGNEVIRVLKQNGWQIVRIKGSHHLLAKPGVPGTVTVPVHGTRELPTGTLNAILKQAGLK